MHRLLVERNAIPVPVLEPVAVEAASIEQDWNVIAVVGIGAIDVAHQEWILCEILFERNFGVTALLEGKTRS